MHSRWLCSRTEVPARLISRAIFDTVQRRPRWVKDEESGQSTGFTNQQFSDSWAVGLWRTDHAHHHDGRGLDDCFASIRSFAFTTGRQGAGRPNVSRSPALFRGSQHHLACASGPIRALEQRVEAVLAIEPDRYIRSLLRCARGDERDRASRSDVRFHRSSRPCLSGRGKRGQNNQALGRSRGGFSTKIHLKTDFGGLPIAFQSPVVRPATAVTSKRCSTSAPVSIRAPRSVTRATIPNQTARSPTGAEYARQSRIDPTPKTYPPSFRKFSTRVAPVSSKQSASSNGSSASRCVARRPRRITPRSSHLLLASS
jgi:hypothetical protein